MEEILQKANELGLMIKGSDLFQRLEELSHKLEGDEKSRILLEEYAQLSEEMYVKEQEGAPVEIADKKKHKELSEKVSENELLKEYLATQTYYVNLMMHIQRAINEPQGDPIGPSRLVKPGGGKIITDL